jgi:hypothetical protein
MQQDTNLLIQMSPLKATFEGSPQELAIEIIRRCKIVSPTGTNFIFIGDVEPTSDVGPWLKNNTQWFVFDPEIKRYVPQDISESETKWFWMQASTPPNSTPPVWLKTTKDQTETDTSHGDPIGWYVFNGTAWVPYISIVLSGPTASRPASPVNFQQFYDTDISTLIWWERLKWRTVSGVPGDVKAVAFQTLTEATIQNPGWNVLGASNQSFRGRILMQAAKDSGASPATVLTVGANVAVRAAFETFGETDGVKVDGASPLPYPPQMALWHLVKE